MRELRSVKLPLPSVNKTCCEINKTVEKPGAQTRSYDSTRQSSNLETHGSIQHHAAVGGRDRRRKTQHRASLTAGAGPPRRDCTRRWASTQPNTADPQSSSVRALALALPAVLVMALIVGLV